MFNRMHSPKPSPEADLITCCCLEGIRPDSERIERAMSLIREWDGVTDLAASNGVSAMVLPCFGPATSEGWVPESVLQTTKANALHDIAVTSHLIVLLKEILIAFEGARVPILNLKGAALAYLLYDDPAVRPSSDIDLLCREEDFEASHRVLVSLGYTPDDAPHLPSRHSPDETFFERRFRHANGICVVELHVDAIKLGVKPKHFQTIWERTQIVDVQGTAAMTMGLEDQLLMLCVHLHRHGFNRLVWFKDIDLLIRKFGSELDWSMVLEQARSEGVKSSLWHTLRFTRMLLDTPLPDDVLDSLRPPMLLRWAFNMIWGESQVLNLDSTTKRRAVQFSVLESWRGMIPSLVLMGRRKEKMRILLRRMLSK